MSSSFRQKLPALILALLASACHTWMSAAIKSFGRVDQSLVSLGRFLVSFSWIMFVNLSRHRFHVSRLKSPFQTEHWGLYWLRSLLTIASIIASCLALKYLPLANASTLFMAQALFVPLVEFAWLGKRSKVAILGSILLGFLGVGVMLNSAWSDYSWQAIYGLLSGLAIAISYVNLRQLSHHDKPHVIMSIHFTISLVISAIYAAVTPHAPLAKADYLALLQVGIAGAAYQEFVTRAMARGPTKMVSMLQYSGLIFSALLGWLAWGEIPSARGFAGMLLIALGSGLTVYWS